MAMSREPLPTPLWRTGHRRTTRLVSALASAAIVLLVGLALVLGLRAGDVIGRGAALIAISLHTAPPPPPPSPRPQSQRAQSQPTAAAARLPAGAAPRTDPARATLPVTAPVTPIVLAPPIIAAPLAGIGASVDAGGAVAGGPGTGAGGSGSGSGGIGEGDASRPAVPAEQIKGRLSPRDFPHGLIAPGAQVSVRVAYTIRADGRVDGCRVVAPSGYAQVDAMVCRLITDRFRYRPARDRTGRAVDQPVVETHAWARRTDS
jgi:protein TonB